MSVTIRTRKVLTNRLLNRKQMVSRAADRTATAQQRRRSRPDEKSGPGRKAHRSILLAPVCPHARAAGLLLPSSAHLLIDCRCNAGNSAAANWNWIGLEWNGIGSPLLLLLLPPSSTLHRLLRRILAAAPACPSPPPSPAAGSGCPPPEQGDGVEEGSEGYPREGVQGQ
jgi:hypothetical protein